MISCPLVGSQVQILPPAHFCDIMDSLLKKYLNEGNLKMVLRRQEEVLVSLPKDGLLYRDIGSFGMFYQCANCSLIIPDVVGTPQESECSDCGNKFYEDGRPKITDATALVGIEYEWEDLEETSRKNRKIC